METKILLFDNKLHCLRWVNVRAVFVPSEYGQAPIHFNVLACNYWAVETY